ncbi:MAG TPA: primosomal protein N' [Solirubrobacteraceae bacterium]|nr:primosomal protein N' [Solirubrobacteraceae bacterium]
MPAIAKVEPLTTARALRGPFDYRLPEPFRDVDVGSLLVIPFGRRRVLGVVVALAGESDIAPERLAAPLEALELGVPAELVRLAGWVADQYCSTAARALSLVLPPGTGLRQLPATGRPRARRARPAASPVRTPVVGRATRQAPRLTAEQRAALEPVVAAVAEERPEAFLLHGVTASGKTEVYLGAAAAALERGRSAIVLVPEIGLTPQVVARFQARFGPRVAVLHSRLAGGERHDEWLRLRRGEAQICVGPRSAVFAPVRRLGLLVVDEEHDPSYKHEGDPRYDARRVAARRASDAEAVLMCGSATPRPESYRSLRRLRLSRRVDGRPLPPVEVVDMRGAAHSLHPRTRGALEAVRRERQKAIVLLNRRGWSNFVSCRACGHMWGCPECDVALILHRRGEALACHHCGHREPVPRGCPACGSLSVARHGAGTERVERELLDALGGEEFPIFRLDSDSASARGAAAELLARFDAAPAGVLLGTQMVAKGHDFPDVTLGAVLDADSTLRFPDFRAEERTFALIAQLAGRAGRGPRGGHVLVQTLSPDTPAIALAARHDADGFLVAELERRAVLRYPPFADLIRIVCSSVELAAAERAAAAMRAAIHAPRASVLGPAPLFRLRGRHRSQVVVKAPERQEGLSAVRDALDTVVGTRTHRRVAFSVDVDPQ